MYMNIQICVGATFNNIQKVATKAMLKQQWRQTAPRLRMPDDHHEVSKPCGSVLVGVGQLGRALQQEVQWGSTIVT